WRIWRRRSSILSPPPRLALEAGGRAQMVGRDRRVPSLVWVCPGPKTGADFSGHALSYRIVADQLLEAFCPTYPTSCALGGDFRSGQASGTRRSRAKHESYGQAVPGQFIQP